MKLRLFCAIIFLVFFSEIAFSQADAFPSFYNSIAYDLEKLSTQKNYNNTLNNGKYIEGSPYLNKEFITGTFYLKGQAAVEIATQLNLYDHQFEYLNGEQILYVDPSMVDSVSFNDKLYVYKMLDLTGINKNYLVEKIKTEGNTGLYKLRLVEFKPEIKAGGYIDPEPATFEWDNPVYVLNLNLLFIPLSNFNKLYDAFPDHKKELKKFIKKNKIRKDDEEGLALLINYIEKY